MHDLRQFMVYIAVGSFVFVVDTGAFALFMCARMSLFLAATFSYLLGIGTHFSLNRILIYRNFERSSYKQIKTYIVVAGFCYLTSLSMIEIGTRFFHLIPLTAKFISIAINIPIGYLCHRHFTFGEGIRSSFRRILLQVEKAK